MGAKEDKRINENQVTFRDLENQPTEQQLCNLRWIKTPCSYASLGSTFSLLQQDIMLQVSAKLQEYINQYYDQMRYKEKTYPKSPFLSEEQKREALHIRIDMSELVDNHSNYKEMVQEFDERGILPWSYCPDTDEQVLQSIECGVRLVTVNNPEPALRILAEKGLHR